MRSARTPTLWPHPTSISDLSCSLPASQRTSQRCVESRTYSITRGLRVDLDATRQRMRRSLRLAAAPLGWGWRPSSGPRIVPVPADYGLVDDPPCRASVQQRPTQAQPPARERRAEREQQPARQATDGDDDDTTVSGRRDRASNDARARLTHRAVDADRRTAGGASPARTSPATSPRSPGTSPATVATTAGLDANKLGQWVCSGGVHAVTRCGPYNPKPGQPSRIGRAAHPRTVGVNGDETE